MTELREKLQNFLKREEERLYGPEPDPEFFGAEREGRDSFRTGFVLLLEPLLKSMSIIQEAFDDSDNAALILSNGMDEIDKLLKAEEMADEQTERCHHTRLLGDTSPCPECRDSANSKPIPPELSVSFFESQPGGPLICWADIPGHESWNPKKVKHHRYVPKVECDKLREILSDLVRCHAHIETAMWERARTAVKVGKESADGQR